jgi:D-alanine-D-alanine ligase
MERALDKLPRLMKDPEFAKAYSDAAEEFALAREIPMSAPKRIALVYDAAAAEGDEASRDVFDQMDAIEPILAEDGDTRRIGVTLDLAALRADLAAFRPDIVFNLAESVGGADRLQTLVPLLLEELRIPFTGCASGPMLLSNDKLASKQHLAAHGLPVPACVRLVGNAAVVWPEAAAAAGQNPRGDWLVKAVSAHASLHMDDSSVLRGATAAQAADAIRAKHAAHGIDFFAEQFIDGREFNISLLGRADGGVDVLPPAEIDFSGLPAASEKIVGYAAKWTEDSAEYTGTVRTFDFPARDADLLAALATLSERTWRAMHLSGYARVDYRVDAANTPYILEINTNPCLTPGSGFPAAAERANLSYPHLIRRIAVL